jgi:phage gp45-like
MSPIPTQPIQPTPPCCRHNIVKGKDQLIIETSSGQRITLNELSPSVLIEDANGNTIRLDASGISIASTSTLQISSAVNVALTAPVVTVSSPMAKFTGVLQADTVMANSVIASSYTPGAGNVW